MKLYQTGDLHFGRTNASKEIANTYVNFPVHSKTLDTYEALKFILETAKKDPDEKVLLIAGDQFQESKVHAIHHFFFKKFLKSWFNLIKQCLVLRNN